MVKLTPSFSRVEWQRAITSSTALKRRIEYLAPVHVYPGQDEMLALTENALAVLRGERVAKDY